MKGVSFKLTFSNTNAHTHTHRWATEINANVWCDICSEGEIRSLNLYMEQLGIIYMKD